MESSIGKNWLSLIRKRKEETNFWALGGIITCDAPRRKRKCSEARSSPPIRPLMPWSISSMASARQRSRLLKARRGNPKYPEGAYGRLFGRPSVSLSRIFSNENNGGMKHYFSTPVITMPCVNWRCARKNINAGSMTAIVAVANESPGVLVKVPKTAPIPTEMGKRFSFPTRYTRGVK